MLLLSILLFSSLRRRPLAGAAAKLAGELEFQELGVFQLPEEEYGIHCEPEPTAIALLIDNSEQTAAYLEETKNAALEIASLLPLDSPGLRFFLATGTRILLSPNGGYDGPAVERAILSIRPESKRPLPPMDDMLKRLSEQMEKEGAKSTKNLLLLFHNGRVEETEHFKRHRGQALHQLQHHLKASIHALTLDPDSDLSTLVAYTNCSCRIYRSDGFPQLLRNVGRELCNEQGSGQADPSLPPGPCDLRPGIEVILVLDASSSVSPLGRDLARSAARAIVLRLGAASQYVSFAVASLTDAGLRTNRGVFSADVPSLLAEIDSAASAIGPASQPPNFAAAAQRLREFSLNFGDQRKRLLTIYLTNGALGGLGSGPVTEVERVGLREEVWAFGLEAPLRRNLLELSRCECRLGSAAEVESVVERLEKALCPSSSSRPGGSDAPQPGLVCQPRIEVDVLLLVDTSRHMRGHFEETKAAAKAIVATLPIAFGARVGIVSFTDYPTSHIRLVDHQDPENIAAYIDYLQASDHPGRAVAAIDYAVTILQTDARSVSNTWVIFLSNGKTIESLDGVEAAAKRLDAVTGLVFAQTLDSEEPNLPSLVEYTQCLCRVFAGPERAPAFLAELREALAKAERCDWVPAADPTPLPDPGFGYPGRRIR